MLRQKLVPVLTFVMSAGLALGCGSSSTTGTGGSGGATGGSGGSTGGGGGSTGGSGGSTGGSGGATGGSGGASGGSGGATGGSGGAAGGAGGTRTVFKCGTGMGSTNTCTQAERDSYNKCLLDNCSTAYAPCIGSNFQSTGELGGVCGTWLKCVNACDCGNAQCFLACGPMGPPADCTSCLQTASSCQMTKCPQPACFSMMADAGMSMTSDAGAGGGSCTALKACCDMIADANTKAACNSSAGSGMEQQCGQLLAAFKGSGMCK